MDKWLMRGSGSCGEMAVSQRIAGSSTLLFACVTITIMNVVSVNRCQAFPQFVNK